jgi:hypothetical protein
MTHEFIEHLKQDLAPMDYSLIEARLSLHDKLLFYIGDQLSSTTQAKAASLDSTVTQVSFGFGVVYLALLFALYIPHINRVKREAEDVLTVLKIRASL